MSLTLPDIPPTARTFTAGTYPVAVIRFLRGNTIRRILSNKPTRHRLSLQYENIDCAIATEFVNVYRACRAQALPVLLSAGVTAGMEGELPDRLLAPEGTFWYWAAPPTRDDVQPLVTTLSIELEVDY